VSSHSSKLETCRGCTIFLAMSVRARSCRTCLELRDIYHITSFSNGSRPGNAGVRHPEIPGNLGPRITQLLDRQPKYGPPRFNNVVPATSLSHVPSIPNDLTTDLGSVLSCLSPNRHEEIQLNIPSPFQEIGIFLTQDRFVSVLPPARSFEPTPRRGNSFPFRLSQ
jgi:hypothetical protein